MKKLFYASVIILSGLSFHQCFAQETNIMGMPIFAYGSPGFRKGKLFTGEHFEARISLDLWRDKYGYSNSISDEKDRALIAQNIAIVLTEGFIWGSDDNPLGIYKPHRSGLFLAKDELDNGLTPEYYRTDTSRQAKIIKFYLSEGLEYVAKNSQTTYNGSSLKTVTKLSYLQLPVLVNYLKLINKNTAAIHAGIGAYFAYALSGKFKTTGQAAVDAHFGNSDNDDFKRTDFGIAINAGYMFLKRWDASVGYNLGLKNLSTQPDTKIHISGFSLNIGYAFH
ncbi:MAG TPA: porin family protein [Chitinophagaceae bacterium]|nr:porin family protein [Chitinophagaceae bacterium]